MPKDSSEMAADRIVEVYSAANVIEAQELCAVLEEEAIQTQIVGDQLGNAAGCLPLGEVLEPRIWVRESDAKRAQEIIEEWTNQPQPQWSWPVQGDDEEEPEDEGTPQASSSRFFWLCQGCAIVGTASILIGALWALCNWATMCKYPETTEGVLVGNRLYYEGDFTPDDNIPITGERANFSIRYRLRYGFFVDGKTYYAVDQNGNVHDRHVPIHYDPNHPEQNVVGPIIRPRTILVSTWGIGAILLLVGFGYRGMPARDNPGTDT